MSNECIVQKLKASVSGDLRKAGEARFYTRASSFYYKNGEASVLKILTPGVTFQNTGYVGETEQAVPANTSRNINVSGNCDIQILTRYSLVDLYGGYLAVDLDELTFCSSLEILECLWPSSSGSIENFESNTAIKSLKVEGEVEGDLSHLFTSSACYTFSTSFGQDTHSNIAGDISNFSKIPNVVNLFHRNAVGLQGNVSVFAGGFSVLRDVDLSGCPNITGNFSAFANHNLQHLYLGNTGVTGHLVDVATGNSALAYVWAPAGVQYTDADAAIVDALLASNGATIRPDGHYFAGGTRVESYT